LCVACRLLRVFRCACGACERSPFSATHTWQHATVVLVLASGVKCGELYNAILRMTDSAAKQTPAAVSDCSEWTCDAAGHAVSGGFRELYKDGAETHYKAAGDEYRNPHEAAVVKALVTGLKSFGLVQSLSKGDAGGVIKRLNAASPILDLAAGSGEITLALTAAGFTNVTGCDPFTGAAFLTRVGRPAEPWSFQDIGEGALTDGGRSFELCVCSYALHLVEASWMFAVLYELARNCDYLMVISPHKKPDIPPGSSWEAVAPGEIRVDRVHVRVFKSLAR
jgi:hypothetical protein